MTVAATSLKLIFLSPNVGAIGVLVFGRNQYIKTAPQGSVTLKAFRILRLAKFRNFEAAKPSQMSAEAQVLNQVTWTDEFVDELRQALTACKVFVAFPFYWLVYNQMTGNLISQAATMDTGSTPNDLLQNLDPIALVILIPFMDRLVYPTLGRYNLAPPPILRIFMGFIWASASMVYACVLQHYIYNSPPNSVNVWLQSPAYILIAISEIFTSISGLEYAFVKAPASMKSIVMSIFLFMTALGSALQFCLLPVAQDPYLVWLYGALAVAAFVAGVIFWIVFRKEDSKDKKAAMKELQQQQQPTSN